MAKMAYNPAVKELLKVKEECAEKSVDKSITDGIDKAITLLQAREDYCATVSTQPSEGLQKIYDETLTHPFEEVFNAGKSKWKLNPRMITGPLNGCFLQVFASASKAKRVLEIGMFTGYGAMAFAEVIPSDGEVVTCENDPYLQSLAQGFFDNNPYGKKIQIRLGDANDTLKELAKEGKPFDLVYIDANKAGYIGYYKAIMENNLLSPGGTIMFDNALHGGSPYMTGEDFEKVSKVSKAIKECNDFLQTQTNIARVLVPLGDGVFIVRRKDDTFTAN